MKSLRILFVASVAAFGMWAAGHASAHAAGAGAVTYTQTDHNVTQSGPNFNPCTGAPGTLTQTYNDVFHYTVLANGTDWFTFTTEGMFSFVPNDSSQPSYTGHFQVWGNQNDNLRSGNSTYTFNVHGVGSDGSTISFHENAHYTMNANGQITVYFDNVRCG